MSQQPTHLDNFIKHLSTALAQNTFVKMSLGNYKGSTPELKNIYVKPVLIKNETRLSFNYRYKTKDVTKNYAIQEGIDLLAEGLHSDFRISTFNTIDQEFQYEILPSGKSVLRNKPLAQKGSVAIAHNREKKRFINAKFANYLQALRISDQNGIVYHNAQDKFKQINHYIELLAPLVHSVKGGIKNVVDMGSGKGYLTFALYDFLSNQLKLDAKVTGVEYRPDLVKLCNEIATNCGFDGLNFVEGSIESFVVEKIDLLIALHACDTATDDAIAKGIHGNAQLIVVAPCCHKQIRKEIEKAKVKNDVSFLTKHGIFLERQAEMTTDGLRAMYLEYAGYKTKVFEFISDAHTSKNVMIVATKKAEESEQTKRDRQAKILADIEEVKSNFGIKNHHLGWLLKL